MLVLHSIQFHYCIPYPSQTVCMKFFLRNNMQLFLFAILFVSYLLEGIFCNRPQINEEGKVLADDSSIQKAHKDVLKLTCTANFPVKWVLPHNEQYENYNNSETDGRLETFTSINNVTITLTDLRRTDAGFYSCIPKDSEYRKPLSKMKHDENRIYVFFQEKKGNITFVEGNIGRWTIKEREKKRFDVTVTAPHDFMSKVVVRWFHRYSILMKDEAIIEEIISNSNGNFKKVNPKFKLNFAKNDGEDGTTTTPTHPKIQTGLIIENAHTNLSGDYILSLQALDNVVNYTFTLEVISSSILNQLLVTEENSNVQLNSNYLELGKSYDVWCTAKGLPKQNLSLSCLPYITGDRCTYKTFEKIATFQNALVARVTASQSGTYNCLFEPGKNVSVPFIVTDIPDAQRNQGFNIEVDIMPKLPNIFQHMNVTVTCKMQKYDTYQSPQWYYQSPSGGLMALFSNVIDGYYTIHNLTDEFSNKSVLTINNIQKEHAGTYICKSYKLTNSTTVESNATITVLETVHPWFGNNSSPIEEDFTYSDRAIIVCDAHGEPFPNVQWLKDGSDMSKALKPGINFDKNNTILVISRVISEDSGIYTCIVSNFAGYQVSKLFRRTVIGAFPSYLIAIVAVIVIILIGIICFWFYKRNRSGRAEHPQRQSAYVRNEIVMTNAQKNMEQRVERENLLTDNTRF